MNERREISDNNPVTYEQVISSISERSNKRMDEILSHQVAPVDLLWDEVDTDVVRRLNILNEQLGDGK